MFQHNFQKCTGREGLNGVKNGAKTDMDSFAALKLEMKKLSKQSGTEKEKRFRGEYFMM